jgi:hypothetical protein
VVAVAARHLSIRFHVDSSSVEVVEGGIGDAVLRILVVHGIYDLNEGADLRDSGSPIPPCPTG